MPEPRFLHTVLAACPETAKATTQVTALANPRIAHLASDSRDVRADTLFAALAGTTAHGITFLDQARACGAVALLVDDSLVADALPMDDDQRFPIVRVPNAAQTLARLAASFYAPLPPTCVAVTGTSGKTSVAEFTRQLWQSLLDPPHAPASVGTLGVVRGDGIRQAGVLTTPDSLTLARTLSTLAAEGVTHVALEASSHGLAQYRLDGLRVHAAAFTNLSRDHLDWHGTMEAYFAAKQRLFTALLVSGGTAVLNADGSDYPVLRDLAQARGCRVVDYGEGASCLTIRALRPTAQGIDVTITDDQDVPYALTLGVYGTFQAWNILAALGLVRATLPEKPPRARLREALSALRAPAGRMEYIGVTPKGSTVFVDYAHKPDALRHVLLALRPHVRQGSRLHVVFGCGGNRDAGKRPMMGAIAYALADQVVITDDNPRDEDPEAIRRAILAGMPHDEGKVREIAARDAAIAAACHAAGEGDCVVIAGKGHETGQVIRDRTVPFDDRMVVKDFLK